MKIKEFWKKLVSSSDFPFLILFVVLMVLYQGPLIRILLDDAIFQNALQGGKSIFEFIGQRYMNWSSRIVIESACVIVAQFDMVVWKLINIFMYIVLARSIKKVCLLPDSRRVNFIICFLLLLFPMGAICSAGWIATNANYLWVASLGLYTLSILVDYSKDEKIPWYRYLLTVLAGIYACNQEQMAGVTVCALLVFMEYYIYQNGMKFVLKKQKFLLVLLLIAILSLVSVLICPGNKSRLDTEIASWYHGYEDFNVLQKTVLGIAGTGEYLMKNISILYVIFSVVLLIGVCKTSGSKVNKILALIPFVSSLLYALFKRYFYLYFPEATDAFFQMTPDEIVSKVSLWGVCLTFMEIAVFGDIAYCLYVAFKDTKKWKYVVGVFVLGLISRVVMGFSPTVFASGERTFIFFYVALIMGIMMILDKSFVTLFK